MKNAIKTTVPMVSEKAENVKAFEGLKRAFEAAYRTGGDYAPELLELSRAVAASVVKKCLDPQRKTAPDRSTVSDNGFSPVLVAMRRGIQADRSTLERTAWSGEHGTMTTYDRDGNVDIVPDNREALAAWHELAGDTLTDGSDLVQEAAAALVEWAEMAAAADVAGGDWLDMVVTGRRYTRHVVIKLDDRPTLENVDSTPIQEVYRAVRREIERHRAPRVSQSGYTYIPLDMDSDGMDGVYWRAGHYADVGGYDVAGTYTATLQGALDYYAILAALDLTPRQLETLEYIMRGVSVKEIARHHGVTPKAVRNTLEKVRRKAENIGFTPGMWREMCESKED